MRSAEKRPAIPSLVSLSTEHDRKSHVSNNNLPVQAADRAPAEQLPGFTHGYADVNSTRIHYVSGGSGDAVMLVHGWPYTWLEWRRVMPLLAGAGYHVIVPDLRGSGDSAKPDDGYSKSNVAEDLRQLLQAHGHTSVHLVGTDIGMMVAYAFAAANPGMVRTLVLSESLLPGFGLEELMNPATGGYWHFGFHMQTDLAAMLLKGNEKAYLGGMWSMMSTSSDSDLADRLLPYYTAPGAMRGGLLHYATLLEDGRENRARTGDRLSMPVLALNGEKGIPQQQTVDAAHLVASDVQVDLVPGSGHAFAEDNPGWLAARLDRFFRGVR